MAETFRNLPVWQCAVQMTVLVYRATEQFPKAEAFGLTSQLRRASVSVASNIAEGYGRGSTGEYKQFLTIARGRITRCKHSLSFRAGLRSAHPT